MGIPPDGLSSEAMSKLDRRQAEHWAEVFPSNGLLQRSDYQVNRGTVQAPQVGAKSAQRLAFHIINMPKAGGGAGRSHDERQE